ncbi:MAG: 16S rRNA (uracil1498-N3)-methyltransferase [Chitinophagaceae bacterium]|nr:MAG: 16S rRNA (uracil1498-N3)-methyltransferase [Chitinophagaceae bacterium]
MSTPFFYEAFLPLSPTHFELSAETSKHCIQVLRMQVGETIALTNGLGLRYDATIVSADKKQTVVSLSNQVFIEQAIKRSSIAISFVKNAARMEWFLEKATEIGVAEFYPLISERTERAQFKAARWESILVSAMLQSQQVWKPQLHAPIEFGQMMQKEMEGLKMIAHCEEGTKQTINEMPLMNTQLMLIGPEGDFTSEEISTALAHQFKPVSLGNTRLRTETAALAAAVLMQNR